MIPIMVAIFSKTEDFLAVEIVGEIINETTTIVKGNSTPKVSGIR